MPKLHITYQAQDTLANLQALAAAGQLEPLQHYWATDELRDYYAADENTLISASGDNIYNTNGALNSDRTITLGEHDLLFSRFKDDYGFAVLFDFESHSGIIDEPGYSGPISLLLDEGVSLYRATNRLFSTANINQSASRYAEIGTYVFSNGDDENNIAAYMASRGQSGDEAIIRVISNGISMQGGSTLISTETTGIVGDAIVLNAEDIFIFFPPENNNLNDILVLGSDGKLHTRDASTLGGSGSSKWSQGTGEIFHTTDDVRIGEVDSNSTTRLKLHGHTANVLELNSTPSSSVLRNRQSIQVNGNQRWLWATHVAEIGNDSGSQLSLTGYDDNNNGQFYLTFTRQEEIWARKPLTLDYSIPEDAGLNDVLVVDGNGKIHTRPASGLGGGGGVVAINNIGATSSDVTINGNTHRYHIVTMEDSFAFNLVDGGSDFLELTVEVHQNSSGDHEITDWTGNNTRPAGIPPQPAQGAGVISTFHWQWNGSNWRFINMTSTQQ